MFGEKHQKRNFKGGEKDIIDAKNYILFFIINISILRYR